MSKNYVELLVSDLREECKKRDLESTGLKVHLVERLTKYDKDIVNLENAAKEAERKAAEPKIVIEDKTVKKDEEKKNQGKKDENEPSKKNVVSPVKSAQKSKQPSLLEKACSEPDNWESRTDVHLDFYNSDLHLVLEQSGFSAQPITESGFEFLFASAKANYGLTSGKVFYEVKVTKKVAAYLGSDVGEPNVVRVGWSANNTSLALGEEELSFSYEGSAKKLVNNVSQDYGVLIKEGDVVGCYLEFCGDNIAIRFSTNGIDQGEAFTTTMSELGDHMLLPHVSVRNFEIEVNFGLDKSAIFPPKTSIEGEDPVDDISWELLGNVDINQRKRALLPPKTKADCEVLMMCGLPSCGKTIWVEKLAKSNQDKCYNVLSTNVILDKMKVMNLRKKCAGSRWDTFIQSATQCLNKMMEIAVKRRRNFVLDQTNVYPTAQRRRMKTFEEFIRKAIIIVPTDEEYQRRMNQVVTDEGKDVPESAVLQMKENFVIPGENSDLFKEILFIELQRPEAELLVKQYNEEAKTKKKEDEQSNKRHERDDSSPIGLWGSSPKKSDADVSGASASKKSRWNEDRSDDKSSKSKDYDSKGSSSAHASRKSEYKGGFCFAREADDTDKGGRGANRVEEKDRSRGKDSRDDRYAPRPSDSQSRRSDGRRDRDEGRFGQSEGRSRERVSDNRTAYGQSRDRPASGGYEDRRHNDAGTNREKFPSSGRFGASDPPARQSRFQPLERGDVRGRGRGGAAASSGVTRFNYGATPKDQPYQKSYTKFNPYEENNSTFDTGYTDDTQDYDYTSSQNEAAMNYGGQLQPQRGGARGGFGVPIQRGGIGAPIKSAGSAVAARGGYGGAVQSARTPRWGGTPSFDGTPHTDTAFGPTSAYGAPRQTTPYDTEEVAAYGESKSVQKTMSKFSNPYDNKTVASTGGYFKKPDDSSKSSNPYAGKTALSTGVYANKTDDTPKFANPYDSKSTFSSGYFNKQEDVSKFGNPYDNKTGGNFKKPDETAKFSNPYKTPNYSNKPDDSSKMTNPYNTPAGSYGNNAARQTVASANVYEDYQSYSNAADTENYDYYSADATETATGQSAYSYTSAAYKANTSSGYDASAAGQYKSLSTGSSKTPSNMLPSGANKAASAGAYNSPYSTSYNTQSNASYNTPMNNTPMFNAPANAAYNTSTNAAYNAPTNAAYSALTNAAYNTSTNAAYNAPTNAAYNAQTNAAYNAQTNAAYNAPTNAAYNSTINAGYNAPTNAAYNATANVAYNAAANVAYNTPTNAAYNASANASYSKTPVGSYNNPTAGAYSNAASGSYTNTPSGSYTNQASTRGAASKGSNDAYGNQTGGTYTNPYSDCYDSSNTSGSYNYYNQGTTATGSLSVTNPTSFGTKAAVDGSAAAATPASNAAQPAYGDYSQYYQSYGQGYGN